MEASEKLEALKTRKWVQFANSKSGNTWTDAGSWREHMLMICVCLVPKVVDVSDGIYHWQM